MQIRLQKSLFLAGVCAGIVSISGCNYDVAEEALSSNPAPVTQPDVATVPVSGELLGVDVLGNDLDPAGDPLFLVSAAATVGQVDVENNKVNYFPPDDYSGEVSVIYTVSDGFWERTEFLSVTVGDDLPSEDQEGEGSDNPDRNDGSVNLAPVAEDDLAEMASGLGATIVRVLDNDHDPDGDSLYLLDALMTSGEGTVSIFDGSVIYIAPKGFSGEVNIQYIVSDGDLSTVGQATVVVVSGNHPPIAREDTGQISQGETLSDLNVLANDEDPEKAPLTLVDATSGVGAVQFSEAGDITFTPNDGFEGVALVTYVVSDGEAESEGELLVTVLPQVDPESTAPVVVDDAATVVYGELLHNVPVLDNDFDPAGGTLSLVSVRPIVGSGASAIIESDNTITYDSPPGIYGDIRIFYTVSNGQEEAEGVLTVTVVEADDEVANQEPDGSAGEQPETEGESHEVMLQVASSEDFESYVIAHKKASDAEYTYEVIDDNSGFISVELGEPGQYKLMVAPYVNGLTGVFSDEFSYSVVSG